ncbi:MAG: Co2+/Mg2+ efflux protein ApaG [Myxococcaceae bacterium]|nr:Co2+/Mg2+ efflux protein ApaG [Myxococcaceae bacterium]
MSTTTTDGVKVSVKPAFWPERSQPQSGQFAFTYTVQISNVGTVPVQLMSRHWIITDGNGRVEEVKGDGVVGKKPRLEPGEAFEYTSWAMLKTPFGTMRGTYFMERQDGQTFEAKIAEFVLSLPNGLN